MSSSWLPAHYRRFNATTGRSDIFNCIDISPSWFTLIGFLLASVEDFPSSIPRPEPDSRCLYTGHRMAHKQAPAMLISGELRAPDFDAVLVISMRHRQFAFARLSDSYLTVLYRLLPYCSLPHSHPISSIRQFEINPCRPISVDLPPSQIQHCAFTTRFLGTP